ncbi:hypothetical protein l13_09230 [Neisseria weaveri ATCC 51223]|nr:hypothetical protein l13_09230 [Neisseria weaveri ATCC 51223]
MRPAVHNFSDKTADSAVCRAGAYYKLSDVMVCLLKCNKLSRQAVYQADQADCKLIPYAKRIGYR